MEPVLLLISSIALVVASEPFKIGPCKQDLLSLNTGIEIKNNDWQSDLFMNIHSRQPGKIRCVKSTRTVELDSSQYAVFRETIDYKDKTGKRKVEFNELYLVSSDHYVFQYKYDKGMTAEVHIKWLKFIPGLLDIHYICSDDVKFAKNRNDFILVETDSADPSPTVSFQIKEIIEENKLNVNNLRMVSNCNCFADQPDCEDQELYEYLEYRLP